MVSVPDCLEQISAVLQLLGQLENAGPPPASQEAIQNLPTVSISQENVGMFYFIVVANSMFHGFSFFYLVFKMIFGLCV